MHAPGGLLMALTPLRVHEHEGRRVTFTCTYRSSERHTIEFVALPSQEEVEGAASTAAAAAAACGGANAEKDSDSLVNYYSLGGFRCCFKYCFFFSEFSLLN